MKPFYLLFARLYLVAALLLLLPPAIGGTKNPLPTFRKGRDHALFFAVSDYKNPKFDRLKNPVTNARAIASVLSSKYGFDTTVVVNPTLRTIASKIEEFRDKFARNENGRYPENGQLIIYFSGHGMLADYNGYFIPSDGDPYSPITSAFAYKIWRPVISAINCKHILVAIDACYSSSFSPKYGTQADPVFKRPEEYSEEQKIIINHDENKTRIFFTSDAKEKETPDLSTFAIKFLQGLNQNNSSFLTSTQLYSNYIDFAFPKAKAGDFEGDSGGAFLFFMTQTDTDTDLDGIPDTRDNCPNQYGSSSNNGCPPALLIPGEMVQIKGGDFELGDVMGDQEEVRVGIYPLKVNNFLLAKSELTFDEFDAFCDATGRKKPSDDGWGRGKLPVFNITWYDAVEYCNWRSTKEGFQAFYKIDKSLKDVNNMAPDEEKKWLVTINAESKGYRLPTEAEWEYAARQGGKKVRFGNGKNIADPKEINFNGSESYKKAYSVIGEYRQRPLPVGSLFPNDLQLHDMSGNVWEWCWNWYSIQKEENGPISGSARVVKGGSCYDPPEYIRANYCFYYAPDYYSDRIGFRLAKY